MRVIQKFPAPMRSVLDAIQRRMWSIAVKLEMLRERELDIDDYTRRVNALHRRLGVPSDYARRGMAFCRTPAKLVSVPGGRDGVPRLMTPATGLHFASMRDAAAADGVVLEIRCAFRSVDEQAQLIREQLYEDGGCLEQLLTWIAAPGYSEHHTGRALDFECIPDGLEFENTRAFDWLCRNAGTFNFELSYPRDNTYGIIFEPWHWCFRTEEDDTS